MGLANGGSDLNRAVTAGIIYTVQTAATQLGSHGSSGIMLAVICGKGRW